MSERTVELHAREIRQLQPDELSDTYTGSAALAVRDGAHVAEVVESNLPTVLHHEGALQQADTFYGAGDLGLTDKQKAMLAAPIDPEDIDILPTGEIYYAHDQYRHRLNEAIGIGQWCLRPMDGWSRHGNTVVREFALMVNGKFAATGLGEADYYENNKRSSWATACESAKSIALRRACKEIGIALECWNKRYAETWKKAYAVKVWRTKAKNNEGEYQWRRKDAEPYYDEAPPKGLRPPEPPQATENKPTQTDAVKPKVTRSESSDGEESGKKQAIIAPRAFGKIWGIAGYVIDDRDRKWTFPTNLLPLAEDAIKNNYRLVVQYEPKGNYRNVTKVELE